MLQLALLLTLSPSPQQDLVGAWRGALECPGGEIPFGLEFDRGQDGSLGAVLINGPERWPAPRLEVVAPQAERRAWWLTPRCARRSRRSRTLA